MAMTNFRIEYLAPFIFDGTAKPVVQPTGYFRHEMVVAAEGKRDAIRAVQERGGTVLYIQQIARPRTAGLFGGKVGRAYKLKLLQALSFNVKSGLSPEKALEEVVLGEVGPNRPELNKALDAVRSGFGFVDGLDTLGWFDESTIAVLRAGELSGSLGQSLGTAVSFYERNSNMLTLMFGAFAWTLIDLLMAVSTVAGMRFGLIEELRKTPIVSDDPSVILHFNAALDFAQVINNVLLGIAFVVTVGVMYLVTMVLSLDVQTRAQGFAMLERIPLIKDVLKSGGLAGTCRVLSSLLSGGVLLLDSLAIVQKGSPAPKVRQFWVDVERQTEVGEPPNRVFNHAFLEGSERLILRTHRDQQQLAEALHSIAGAREEQAASMAKKFSVVAFLASLFYSGVAVISSLYVVYLQNQAVLSGAG